MSRRRIAAWFGLAMILVAVALVWWKAVPLTAEPFFQLTSDTRGKLIDDIIHDNLPNRGHMHSAFAFDQLGNTYLLASKQSATNKSSGKVSPTSSVSTSSEIIRFMPAKHNIVHVLVVDAQGQIRRVIPLRRMDGRPIRNLAQFLAVSPSGQRLWTLRQSQESAEDWQPLIRGEKRTILLNAYDSNGKPIGEWKVPTAWTIIDAYALAADEERAYVVLETLEEQMLVYKPRVEQPEYRPYPGSWQPGTSFITTNGQFWHLLPSNSGNVQAFVTHLKKPSVLFTTFQWQPQGFTPFLFWADDEIGLFVFKHLYEHAPTSTPPRRIRSDGAKAVYHVAPDGTVQKLFETPDILQQRFGYQVRTGQPLKADANYIWLEAEYLKNGKVTEYQIVKVKYR
jgi:hypothetical protein